MGGRGSSAVRNNNIQPERDGDSHVISVENGSLTYRVSSSDDIYVERIIVKKESRQTGIGTQLLNTVKEMSDNSGLNVKLDAWPVNSNMSIDELIQWYENRGFVHMSANQMLYESKKRRRK